LFFITLLERGSILVWTVLKVGGTEYWDSEYCFVMKLKKISLFIKATIITKIIIIIIISIMVIIVINNNNNKINYYKE